MAFDLVAETNLLTATVDVQRRFNVCCAYRLLVTVCICACTLLTLDKPWVFFRFYFDVQLHFSLYKMKYSVAHCLFLLAGMLVISFPSTTATDAIGKIAIHPACKDDIARLCNNELLANDLAVLDCLQNRRSDSDADLSAECHSVCVKMSDFFKYCFINNISLVFMALQAQPHQRRQVS